MNNTLRIYALLAVASLPLLAQPTSKDALMAKYKGKFLVVEKDGLSTVGLDAGGGVIDLDDHGNPQQDLNEPVRKGEVLHVAKLGFRFGKLHLVLVNVTPHSVTRGIGAFAHESVERGFINLGVPAGSSGKDFAMADTLLAQWFKPFDTAAAAANFGNTASGVFVKEVKAGMSFAEVEEALGVPVTRVDLGEKVLYKYKDTTVEFHDGKVVDVR